MFSDPKRVAATLTVLAVITLVTGCGGDAAREVAHLDFETSELIPDGATLDTEFVHGGETSFYVFAEELILLPLLDVEPAAITGDSLTVTVWTRTEVMQRPVSLQLVIETADGEARIVSLHMEDVHRTSEWTERRIAAALLPDEAPTRLKLGVHIPFPGKLWLDDLTLWDGSPAVAGAAE